MKGLTWSRMASGNIKDYFNSKKADGRKNLSGRKRRTKRKNIHSTETQADDKNGTVERDIEVLKCFDQNWKYGPCIGLLRMERWNRAEKFGLSPPDEVKQLICSHSTDERYTHCLWHNYKILRN